MRDAHLNDPKAGTSKVPAFVVADPLTPTFRLMLNELREQRRANGHLWLRAFAPKDRVEFLLNRLDDVAVLTAANERGELTDYFDQLIADFDASLFDVRQPVDLPTRLAA